MNFLENNLKLQLYFLIMEWQNQLLNNNKYFGIPTYKIPLDFWVYQEIIYEVKPDVIIEIGNFKGGSTLALAHLLDNMQLDDSKILALDINHSLIDNKVIEHKKIKLITGNAVNLLEEVRNNIKDTDKVLIIEDSSHTYENTLEILKLYSTLVTKDSYFIVEDSIISTGLEVNYIKHGGGPYRAINEFISQNNTFIVDRSREKFIVTWNPKGFLKKIK